MLQEVSMGLRLSAILLMLLQDQEGDKGKGTCLKVCIAWRSTKSPSFLRTRQLISPYSMPGSLTLK